MKKIIVGCLISFVVVAAVVVVVVWLFLFRELPSLDAALSIPPQTTLGTPVAMP